MNVLRKKRTKQKPQNNQKNISGTRIKRIEKCVFCEIGIDLDNQVFVCDMKGNVLHMECFDERCEIIINVRKQQQKEQK